MKPKVIVIRFELTEAAYAEARQFLSDSEIRYILKEGGENELSDRVKAFVRAAQAAGL